MRILAELDAVDRRAESVASGLSPLQLNWQPRQGVWSVGQCLEHLRVGNEILLSVISAALKSGRPGPVDEIAPGPFSRWFVRSFIAASPGGMRAPAPRKIQPALQVTPGVLEGFLRSTQAARQLVRQASSYDVNRIRYPNPFIPLLRFTVGTGLEIIAKHPGRYLLHAEGVRQLAKLPK